MGARDCLKRSLRGRAVLDWSDYDRCWLDGCRQRPLDAAERVMLETIAADIAGVSDTQRGTAWGRCSPPGRFAATVIRLRPEVTHQFADSAAALRVGAVGIKLFKTTADGRREGDKVVRFCRDAIHRLPGLPNAHVQRVIAAGEWQSGPESRHYVVQQWVTGHTLEELNECIWPAQPIDGRVARSIVSQLLVAIVVPLWSAGTIWWDFRDANYCWDPLTEHLTMIDVDSLAAYVEETLETPAEWVRRDNRRQTGLSRLRQMALRVLLAQGIRPQAAVRRHVAAAWADFEPALRTLGKSPHGPVLTAVRSFFDRLDAMGCLV